MMFLQLEQFELMQRFDCVRFAGSVEAFSVIVAVGDGSYVIGSPVVGSM